MKKAVLATVFSLFSIFLFGQSLVVYGYAGEDDEEYTIDVYGWIEKSDTCTFTHVHHSVEIGQYTFEIPESYRFYWIIYTDRKSRKKYTNVFEMGIDDHRLHIDVDFNQDTSLLYYRMNAKSGSSLYRVLKDEKYGADESR